MNFNKQTYDGIITLQLIDRNYKGYNAKRYTLNGSSQNVWIPNKHLLEDGTIKDGEKLDYIFAKSWRQLYYSVKEESKGVIMEKIKEGKRRIVIPFTLEQFEDAIKRIKTDFECGNCVVTGNFEIETLEYYYEKAKESEKE